MGLYCSPFPFLHGTDEQICNTQLATNPKAGGCFPSNPGFQQSVLLFLSTSADTWNSGFIQWGLALDIWDGIFFQSKDRVWFDETTKDQYRLFMTRPGSMHCIVEYYRNIWLSTKIWNVWGKHGVALSASIYEKLEEFAPNKLTMELLDCGHWMQEEVPEEARNRRFINLLQ
jgi:pimeloyl-ACP methyl ester carboxylesterase